MTAGGSQLTTETSAVSVSQYTHERAADWDAYVHGAERATVCHLSGWQRVVETTWEHASHSLLAESGGAVSGVLPLALVRRPFFASMLVSTPAAIYGGVLADDAATRAALLAKAKQLAVELQVDYLELRDAWAGEREPTDADLRSRDLYVTFERPIGGDEESLLSSYPKKIRYMIRQGLRHGLRSEFGRAELLDEFYQCFASNMRNLGTPVYPKQLFAAFLQEFPDCCDLLVVRQGTRVAGAALSFNFRNTVLPHYACTYREFHHTGVSNFMFWELMRNAAARGFTTFDFGRSKVGSGSWSFKRGWRIQERPLPYKYFLVRATRMPELNPTNPRFKLMIEVWKRLPVGLTKLLGPAVVKHIP
jgi:FemAB-related protein (PEP-CTERM system-associated)